MHSLSSLSTTLKKNKKKIRTGTWSVTSLYGKENELIEEMIEYEIDILGISEMKKKGKGTMKL